MNALSQTLPRALALGAVLALCACGSKKDPGRDPSVQPSLNELGVELPAPPDAAKLQAMAEQGLAGVLLQPKGAQYWNLRPGALGAVCGEVNSRQENGRFGGPRPFVVTPEGVGMVSPQARVRFGDPSDLFPDFYIRWCATPEELAKLGPEVAKEEPPLEIPAGNSADVIDPAPPPPAAEAPPSPALSPEPKAQPKPTPPRPRSSDDDSFFNAVIRKED